MINNFKLLPKVAQRALIAFTVVVFLLPFAITKRDQPGISIGSVVVYWVLILLFSWVYAATITTPVKENKPKPIRKKLNVNLSSIGFTIMVILLLAILGNAGMSFYNYKRSLKETDYNFEKTNNEVVKQDTAFNPADLFKEQDYNIK